jgi:hypothetical protein
VKSVLRNVLVSLAIVGGTCIWLAGAASADPPQGMRLYVFSSGWLTLDKSGLQTGATGKMTVPVAFFPSPQGRVRARARITGGLADRVVAAQHGWWQACAALDLPGYDPLGPDGANINLVIGNESFDPVSGAAPHRSYCCRVERLTEAPAAA